MDSLILQVVIGLVFLFGSFAGLVSILTEVISRFVGLRGEYLLRGIRTLVDGPGTFELRWRDILCRSKPAPIEKEPAFVTKLMTHSLIRATADKGTVPQHAGDTKLTNNDRRKLPSYVSSRSFARAVLDLIVPNSGGTTTMTAIQGRLKTAPANEIPAPLKEALAALANDAGNDLATFRTNVAQWYDDQMARVSGWYKRHVRWVSLALGITFVIALNLNVLNIARTIYTDQALRGSVVTQATQASQCANKDPATCLRALRSELTTVRGAGLPIGWSTVPTCENKDRHCSWYQQRGLWGPPGRTKLLQVADFGLLLLGWGLMVIALLPGARFWFDALGQLGSLRSTGPKPPTT